MPLNLSPKRERGAVLVIGLLVLMMITLMVTAAFKFSTYNLKSVGNMQSRNEAIAAANRAIEEVVGSWNFRTAPIANHVPVDIDNNGTDDYLVDIAVPTCIRAVGSQGAGPPRNETAVSLDGTHPPPAIAPPEYNMLWELDAVVTSAASGTKVRVRQGVSKPGAGQAECDAVCGHCSP